MTDVQVDVQPEQWILDLEDEAEDWMLVPEEVVLEEHFSAMVSLKDDHPCSCERTGYMSGADAAKWPNPCAEDEL